MYLQTSCQQIDSEIMPSICYKSWQKWLPFKTYGLFSPVVMDETNCHIHFPDSNRGSAGVEKSNQVCDFISSS